MTATCADRINDIRLRSLDLVAAEGARTINICNRIAADASRTREDRLRIIEIERERFQIWAQGLRELVEESVKDVEAFHAWRGRP